MRDTWRTAGALAAALLGLSVSWAGAGLPELDGFTAGVYAEFPDDNPDFIGPAGLAFDPATGALYVGAETADFTLAPIFRVPPGGGVAEPYGPPIEDPDTVVFDASGVITGVAGAVVVGSGVGFKSGVQGQLTAVAPDRSSFALCAPPSEFYNPGALRADSAGMLVLADDAASGGGADDGALLDGSPCPALLASITPRLGPMDLDAEDNIYTGALDGVVRKHSRDGVLLDDDVASGLGLFPPVAVGPGGAWGTAVYAMDRAAGILYRIDEGAAPVVVGTGFDGFPIRMAFGPDGALYLSNLVDRNIVRVAPNPPDCDAGSLFFPPVFLGAQANARTPELADFDADGDLDIATAGGQVGVRLGNGDGTFGPLTTFDTGGFSSSIAVGDLNGDGAPDIVATSDQQDAITVLLNDGAAGFVAGAPLAAGVYPASAAIGDLNGDRIPDVVVGNGFGDTTVSVYIGLGGGVLSPQTTYPAGPSPYAVDLGDFNADGALDIVATNIENAQLTILLGAGDGSFAIDGTYSAGDGPITVDIDDLNSDGALDLVCANGGFMFETVAVLLGEGDGGFGPTELYDLDNMTIVARIADLNRDGVPDIAVGTDTFDPVFGPILFVLPGLGDGTFGEQAAYLVTAFGIAIGDVNADDAPDVVATASSLIRILLNRCNGAQLCPADLDGSGAVGSADLNLVLADFGQSGPQLPGDLNGDGVVDSADLNGLLADFGLVCGPFCGDPVAGSCCASNGTPACDDASCCDTVCSFDPYCCNVEWDGTCADGAADACGPACLGACCFASGACKVRTLADCEDFGGDFVGLGIPCEAADCSPPACGGPDAGSCCVPNGTPGCNDEACCDLVCAADVLCCLIEWDEDCVEAALDVCGSCSDCCIPNGTPGCDDPTCQGLVCSVDVLCCFGVWDQECADLANNVCSVCGVEKQGACCTGLNDCELLSEADCTTLGGEFQGRGVACGGGVCNPCGDPNAGDCCVPNGTPNCNDADCCELVCTVDPFCCVVPWDQSCADAANTMCAVCNVLECGSAGVGDCCVPNGTPKCNDADCCELVCAISPICCDIVWDDFCVALAGAFCGGCP